MKMVASIAGYALTVRAWAAAAMTLCALLALIPAQAQRYTFRQYDSADGLTDMTILALIEDHTGYIWVGTEDGLFRYDGTRFEAFREEDGLPDETGRGIAESPDGVIWVATMGGVARMTGKRLQTVDVGMHGLFRAVVFDRLGRVYLEGPRGLVEGVPMGGGRPGGEYAFQTVISGKISALAAGRKGVLFCRDGDLWRLESGLVRRIGSPGGLPAERWNSVVEDSLGNLWALSGSQLYELPAGQARFVNRSSELPTTPSVRLDADGHGRVFVSGDAGVVVLDSGKRTVIDAQHGLAADSVQQVVVDHEGSLWLGTEGGGLIRQLGQEQWLSWKREDGLLSNTIWAVRRDRAGQVWVGSNGGLNLIDASGKVTGSWNSRKGMTGDEVYAIAEGPSEDVYAATYPFGLNRFSRQGKLLETYRSASVKAMGWIMSMALDREGRLWAVGNYGCFRSRPLTGAGEPVFDRVEIPGIGEGTNFFDVLPEADGDVWVGSSAGLARYQRGEWRVFTERDGLKPSGVAAIARGQDALWIAYRDAHGLTRLHFEGERVEATHFTRSTVLSSDRIFALDVDPAGRLWATSDSGINLLEMGQWRHYYREDGLVWNDADSLALEIGPQGDVWVGTSAGLARYAPPRHPLSEAAPKVVITSITGAGRQWEVSDRPSLPFRHRSLVLHYTALSYAAETRVRFRYRLLGYEGAWTTTRERSLRFEGLPPGHYVFQVAAIGANSLQSAPAQFVFEVLTPWWQSWWFVLTCLAAGLLMARALWRLRMRVLLAQKKRLEALVAERTSELQESHRQLEEIAFSDWLTALPNRRKFTQQFRARLDLACSAGERFALMLIDLDGFKAINDTFGHDAGDAVLVETAKRLCTAVRQTDCVARLGGDEFAIILFAAYDPGAIEEVHDRIAACIRTGTRYQGLELTVGASVGVAIFPDDGQDETSLYKAADLSLYASKRAKAVDSFSLDSAESAFRAFSQ